VKLALPKGRMESAVVKLLDDAGIKLQAGSRTYRPRISLPGFEVKILKPQNIVEMLHIGSRDLGFAGADWVRELGLEVVELLDTELDPVRVVAAAPAGLFEEGKPPKCPLLIASEYEKLTTEWIEQRGLNATFVRSYGATEVFPPEDADCIVDNTASGSTLKANNLEIVEELMVSSTRVYASPKALADPQKKQAIDSFLLVVRSVIEARKRVMLEVNVSAADLERLLEVVPCMREHTIAPLHGDAGYAVKAAVPREILPMLIPQIRERGGSDIIITTPTQIVP
jgi:ATP phosphoribosyltransferase